MAARITNCNICLRKVNNHCRKVICNTCGGKNHQLCLSPINKEELIHIRDPLNHWSCRQCMIDFFPYNIIEEREEFIHAAAGNNHLLPANVKDLIFKPLEINDIEDGDPLEDLDPDKNYFNENLGAKSISDYYDINSFVTNITNKVGPQYNFSMMHANIRSLPKNQGHLEQLLETLNYEFDIIGLTETWLHRDNANIYNMKNYSHCYSHRSNKKGGGVSIFIKEGSTYKTRDDLGITNNDYEALWVEITPKSEKEQNKIIGVIYRAPNSDITMFNDYLSETLGKIKKEKKKPYSWVILI